MAFIYPTYNAVSRIDSSDKVIKAQDFWAHRKAKQAVADAMAQRDAIIQAAQTQARDAALDAEREAREQHRLAVRMREKFSEMMRTVQEERDFERARMEEAELDEAAEGRFAFASRAEVEDGPIVGGGQSVGRA